MTDTKDMQTEIDKLYPIIEDLRMGNAEIKTSALRLLNLLLELSEQTQPIHVKDKLPEPRQRVLWWYTASNPLYSSWQIGTFESDKNFPPGYFSGPSGAAFVHDGSASYWLPLPPAPPIDDSSSEKLKE